MNVGLQTSPVNYSLSKTDTGALKGIAILAMLFHHIYTCPPAGVEPYTGILLFLGTLGKVCVSMFLFCSAYGLSVQYAGTETVEDSIKFVVKRLIRFYANYWFIFLIFVPIGVFVFGRTLTDAYGANVNVWAKLCYDLLGMNSTSSYSITWWFNRLIIMYYVVFPIAYHVSRKLPVAFFCLSVLLFLGHWKIYWLIFAMGILWQQYQKQLTSYADKCPHIVQMLGTVLLLALFVFVRSHISPDWKLNMDCAITLAFVCVVVNVLRLFPRLMQCFAFLGRHSGNIYMIHTFIYYYWFSKYVYICDLRIGGGILAVLVVCLLLSVLIEYVKAKTGIYKLSNRMIEFVEKY